MRKRGEMARLRE
jgi:hypothetical protein